MNRRLTKLRSQQNEGGMSELISILFTLPLLLALIFTMMDMGSYLSARSMVQGATYDGARQVAMFGGQSQDISLNNTGKTVAQLVQSRLYDEENERCTPSACREIPQVTCTPEIVTQSMGLGYDVSCTTRYMFAPASSQLADIIGLGDLLRTEINITQVSISETYYTY